MEAHRIAALHRALSVFIFNDQEEILIHQRALGKYHSGGLWSNSCCSHPKPCENILEAANRRLREEMGFSCQLKEIGTTIYKINVGNGLTEHELDHLLIGYYNGIELSPEPTEVMDWKYIRLETLQHEIATSPEKFSKWFLKLLPIVLKKSHLT